MDNDFEVHTSIPSAAFMQHLHAVWAQLNASAPTLAIFYEPVEGGDPVEYTGEAIDRWRTTWRLRDRLGVWETKHDVAISLAGADVCIRVKADPGTPRRLPHFTTPLELVEALILYHHIGV